MRAHWLQHVPFEGLGSIAGWLADGGWQVTATRFHQDPRLPEPSAFDLLVVMGGPMSANDEPRLPWLAAEKAFIRAAVEAGKPVLGVCLGAQLIAAALGAPVFPNPVKEIGWFPVTRRGPASAAVFRLPEHLEVFHWHGETFELPAGAVLLASSEACRNQAFQLGRRVIGLQFHLETTPPSAREIVAHCRHELVPGTWVQSEQQILAAGPERYRRVNALMAGLLDYLTAAD